MLKQPNTVTMARYKYTSVQKDIMYHVMEALQPAMSEQPESERFENHEIKINLATICEQGEHTRVLKSIKKMMEKPISYNYEKNSKQYEVTTVFIYAMIHEKGSGEVKLKVSAESVPYLISLAKGFTAYNKKIALTLRSIYSKRMYEQLNRWKDKGGFMISMDEFRKMMNIEDTYKQLDGIKKNVLEVAKKELSEHSDLWFSYTLKKEKLSRAYNVISFKIHNQTVIQKNAEKGTQDYDKIRKMYGYVISVIGRYLPLTDDMGLADELGERKDFGEIYSRLMRFEEDIKAGKIKRHGATAYLATILANEYGVSPEKLPYKKRKPRDDKKHPTLNFPEYEEKKERSVEDIIKNLEKKFRAKV